MHSCDEFHKRKSIKAQAFIDFLHKEILEKLIIKSELEFKKLHQKVKKPLDESKQDIQKIG